MNVLFVLFCSFHQYCLIFHFEMYRENDLKRYIIYVRGSLFVYKYILYAHVDHADLEPMYVVNGEAF